MAVEAIPMWQLQIATAFGLLGIWFGWRGGMRRMGGFYDTGPAMKLMMGGFFLGALIGYFQATFLIYPFLVDFGLSLAAFGVAIVLGFAVSLASMLGVTRQFVRSVRGQPTAGWAMGLGFGAMEVTRFGYVIFALPEGYGLVNGFGIPSLLVLALLGLFLPWTEALICSWQGWNALNGYRFKPALQAAFARALLYCALVYGLYFTPMLFILPAIVIGLQRKADGEWLPSGLTPALRQEWNRIQRTHSRRKAAAVRHRRSSASEEE